LHADYKVMETKHVVILDYKLGNLFSVQQACATVGINATISSDRNDVASADGIILPGVGAFKEAMKNLDDLKLVQPLREFAASGKPLFGVCLGLQLLMTESEEFGATKGLGLIEGLVRKFPKQVANATLKVPQIGWNTAVENNEQPWKQTPLEVINNGEYFYFVHSYYVIPAHTHHVLATTQYEGLTYCSAVSNRNNIFATQFHPEKSAEKGIMIYKRWAELNNLR
jgi:imidazole glycerol-phosphate synthase subunit HisH